MLVYFFVIFLESYYVFAWRCVLYIILFYIGLEGKLFILATPLLSKVSARQHDFLATPRGLSGDSTSLQSPPSLSHSLTRRRDDATTTSSYIFLFLPFVSWSYQTLALYFTSPRFSIPSHYREREGIFICGLWYLLWLRNVGNIIFQFLFFTWPRFSIPFTQLYATITKFFFVFFFFQSCETLLHAPPPHTHN